MPSADRIRTAQADRDSVFDNSVERASRERADSGISLKRSHKMGHSVFARRLEVVARDRKSVV